MLQNIYVLIIASFINPFSLICYLIIIFAIRNLWAAIIFNVGWRVLDFVLYRNNPTPESYKILLLNLFITSIIAALIVSIKNSGKSKDKEISQ
jgi:hypothetical protein